jgi:GH24 family phage-related lysozyme (muramidase)
MALVFVDVISEATYRELRNEQVKIFENRPLSLGNVNTTVSTDSIGNLFIGYGWDLDVNSAQDTLDAFDAAGLALSADERTALINYKDGSLSQAGFQQAWENVSYTEAEATALLNVAFETREVQLSDRLGVHDLPFSAERAAIASQIYNIGANGIPTEISLLRSTAFSDLGAYQQRAEIWWEIAYHSNYDNSRGIQVRRMIEADMFSLYTDDDDPRDIKEALHGYQFLDRKGGENAEVFKDYLTGNGVSTSQADEYIRGHYDPAFMFLVERFGGGVAFEDYRQVIVDQPDMSATLIQNTEVEIDNTIIFAMNGDDTVQWSLGRDFLNGGEDEVGDIFDLALMSGNTFIEYVVEEVEGSLDALFIALAESGTWQSLFTDGDIILDVPNFSP